MKLFETKKPADAIRHAMAGGQALHVYAALPVAAPACFKRRRTWAHLIDHDRRRLYLTAKRLGVRKIRVHLGGSNAQHVDLCGKPLERALVAAGKLPEAQAAIQEEGGEHG